VSRVVDVLRYPVKSAVGERLQAVDVEEGGLRGDRAWACIDAADGTVGSAKHPGRWGRLLDVRATIAEVGVEDPPVTVHVNGQQHLAGTDEVDAALTAHLGRPVRLSRTVPEGARLHRLLPDQAGLVPTWMDGAAGEALVTEVTGARPGGRFVDFGAVHLVTTSALADLARRVGRADVAAVRFRPNLVLDLPADPEPGTELRIGDVALRVLMPTPRCLVPGLVDGSMSVDRALLSTLARDYRTDLPGIGRAACFGFYAEVLHAGQVHVGQRVRWPIPSGGATDGQRHAIRSLAG
jgi:uncharacterized protein YcbX